MTVLSCLRSPARAGFRSALILSGKNAQGSRVAVRSMGEATGKRVMEIRPSRFEWERWKDDIHFYLALGIIPYMAIVLYSNLRIGPAELAEIPEGYVPHSWEYVRHPLQRWFQRNVYNSYEKSYEKMCHVKDITEKKRRNRLLEMKVREMQKKHKDFKGWYYDPYDIIGEEKANYFRKLNRSQWGRNDEF